jgi:glycosyltransferase involved in cell wall biosynthesis
MKICVIGTRGFPHIQGGVEGHCESLYTCFSQDCQFTVFRRKPYVTDHSTTYPHIRFIDLPSTKIKGLEAAIHSFIATCRTIAIHPDIAHIHNIGPAMFSPLLRLCGIKVVMTYHSPNYEHKKWGWTARHVLMMCERIALKASSAIIFVNKFQMQKYSEKVRLKSFYIPNGINRITPATASDFIERLGVTKHDYLLAVGRITPEKGFDYLVKAVNMTDSVKHLVIAGTSDHDDDYLNELKRLDVNHKVIFAGFTQGENLRQLYSHARLYVLSSVNEGFPLVLLEAMNYSLPLVVSDIPASRIIQLPAECYTRAADAKALAASIDRAMGDGFKPIEYNLDDYDWNKIAQQTLEVYKSL